MAGLVKGERDHLEKSSEKRMATKLEGGRTTKKNNFFAVYLRGFQHCFQIRDYLNDLMQKKLFRINMFKI